jgi:hypothetical protein
LATGRVRPCRLPRSPREFTLSRRIFALRSHNCVAERPLTRGCRVLWARLDRALKKFRRSLKPNATTWNAPSPPKSADAPNENGRPRSDRLDRAARGRGRSAPGKNPDDAQPIGPLTYTHFFSFAGSGCSAVTIQCEPEVRFTDPGTTISWRALKCRCIAPFKPAVSRVVPQGCAPLRRWSRSQHDGRRRVRLYPRPAYRERACDLPTRSRLPAG